ncbi:MAG TPA: L-aspartate oxidase [Bacteroidia bacterium]|nr:L-aspartate oxidase [Bacteroidia bacterium]
MAVKQVDFLVIGSGIAGLTYALNASGHGQVLVITKGDEDESNTKYAQGGIAAVTGPADSFEQHVEDTLIAGDGLCDEAVVRMVIAEGPARIRDIISWGTRFDTNASGTYDLAREGGHSVSRILHHKDNTGFEMERSLLDMVHATSGIELVSHYFAIDLITRHHKGEIVSKGDHSITCYGVYALNIRTGEIDTILAKTTLLATGGAGNVYLNTTNPKIATGDGIAMVYRAKGAIAGMEFIQFHPTALYHPGERPSFLISEAVRGFGAVLKTVDGSSFMERYDSRGSLAPRDIVARAIDNEMKKRGDDYVWLDCRGCDAEGFLKHFPNIHNKCLSVGIDFRLSPIPVVPAAHYTCGGIDVDQNGCTTIKHLYAAGECSHTGLHGANRLASNSLLEAAVYAHRAFLHSTSIAPSISFATGIPSWDASNTKVPEDRALITNTIHEVQQLMSNYGGIVRTDVRLQRALNRLNIIYRETEDLYNRTVISVSLMELRNLVAVAYLIIQAASARRENRGLHFNQDLIPHTS